jgi:hypothetical protein
MYTRSGFTESIDIVMHHRKPIDAMELGEYLNEDFGPLVDAQAALWVSADEDLISQASKIVLAAGDVVVKSTTLPPDALPPDDATAYASLVQKFRSFRSLKFDPEIEAARNAAVRHLGQECWTFGQLTRRRLGLNVDDLIRAFPGFAEDLEQSETAAQSENPVDDHVGQ